MDKAKDKTLYKKVKDEVYAKNPTHSAYRSMQIVKQYKKRGGEFKDTAKKPLKQWQDEQWLAVQPYLVLKKKIKCGAETAKAVSACRPSRRVSSSTPITIDELLKKHKREDMLKAMRVKNKDPHNTTLNWHTLKVTKR